MGKKRDFKTTLEHWKFKYKLSILNEKTLEEVLRIRLSRLTVFMVMMKLTRLRRRLWMTRQAV